MFTNVLCKCMMIEAPIGRYIGDHAIDWPCVTCWSDLFYTTLPRKIHLSSLNYRH